MTQRQEHALGAVPAHQSVKGGPTRATTKRRALLAATFRAGAVAVLLGIGAPLLAACGQGRRPSYRPRERVPTVPIQLSERERANKITYYLASITQKGTVVVVDMDLTNGHGRGFQFITVWVTLIGTKGEKQEINYALGAIGPHETNHVIARSRNVVFQVETIDVGVQIR